MPVGPTEREITLEDAIALVAQQARAHGVRLTRTKLVKLLYFVDLRSWERIGRTITGVEWLWHHYGPYSSTIVEACGRMATAGELELVQTANFYGSPEYRIRAKESLFYRPPSEGVTGLVREVVQEFGKLQPAVIGDRSYDTDPMRALIRSGGHRGDRIDFIAETRTPDDVHRAIKRYVDLARNTEGDDEGDVAAGLLEEAEGLRPARLSAGTRVIGER